MFKSAFLSEYSLPPDGDVKRILKTHLLSNAEVVIPAAALRHSNVAKVISANLRTLPSGAVRIAYGNDCNSLLEYLDKYPETNWAPEAVDVFKVFQAQKSVSIYDLRNTFERFNAIMRQCASGNINGVAELYSVDELNSEILSSDDINLFAYFDMVNRKIPNERHKTKLSAFMKYVYNLCGALSTDSGNTFSIENSRVFSHIADSAKTDANMLSGLGLLVSCALDITDGLEDFDFVGDLEAADFDQLSFQDILEIRQNWLHNSIITKYEDVVGECVQAITIAQHSDIELAITHIDRAFELKAGLLEFVKSNISKEIRAYKVHRLSRFLANSAIAFVELLSGLNLIKSIGQGIAAATTEVAVLSNKERQLNALIAEKKSKIDAAVHQSQVLLRSKSPTLEYLRLISERLEG